MTYLLDTNICIYAIKGTYPQLSHTLLSVHPDEIALSAVTVSELEYGAAKSRWGDRTKQILRSFMANFDILPFTEEDAVLFGTLRAQLECAGTPIGLLDAMIGAQGITRHLTVVTHNTKEFSRLPGIILQDWAE